VDGYRAYEALRGGWQSDPVPLTEESPLRAARHVDGPGHENLYVGEAYLGAGATVLRLGGVYGEHDYQRRFEPVLRRAVAWRLRRPRTRAAASAPTTTPRRRLVTGPARPDWVSG
jgi:hypothetical protein